ncbi:MAG: type II toxin-antitoxin system HicB family antitoxin [Pseudanabaena sp.]|jgi:predicted RNase H-like HicB family nuclease
MKDYHINIFYSEEDEAYIADIPDLKYCSAIGETPQQALNEVILAKTAWLEAAKAESKNIPKPRYRPVIYQIVA